MGNPSDNAALPTIANDSVLEKGWLTVGALDPLNPTQLTSYSQQCGIAMNYCLVAPGNVVFIDPDATTQANSILYQGGGTSYAAPLVSGAAVRFSGQLAVYDVRDDASPCYHCLFPDEGEASDGPCATFGVLAPLVGVIGSLQAVEAIKLLAGRRPALGQLTLYDALDGSFRQLKVPRDPDCPVCGQR